MATTDPIRNTGRAAALILLAVVALGNAGCLVVAAGAAAAAGAAGYAHVKGNVCHSINASLDDAVAASRKALADLNMPITGEGGKTSRSAWIDTVGRDGTTINITVDVEPASPPAQNTVSVCVRAGTFGDYPTSDRVLTQISARLAPPAPPGTAAAPGGAPGTTASWTPAPLPPSTAPPPLLPPEPVKKP